jgi:hypothetical protein
MQKIVKGKFKEKIAKNGLTPCHKKVDKKSSIKLTFRFGKFLHLLLITHVRRG